MRWPFFRKPAATWLDALCEAERVTGGVLAHYEARLGVRLRLDRSDAEVGSALFERGLRLRELESRMDKRDPMNRKAALRSDADLIFAALKRKGWTKRDWIRGPMCKEG